MKNASDSRRRFGGRAVDWVNARVVSLRTSRRWGPMIRRHITIATYSGRKSGRVFSIPVGFKRTGDTVTISVSMPDAKRWWRNFVDEGQPISLELDGADRAGHAVARRDAKGRVSLTVQLSTDSPAAS